LVITLPGPLASRACRASRRCDYWRPISPRAASHSRAAWVLRGLDELDHELIDIEQEADQVPHRPRYLRLSHSLPRRLLAVHRECAHEVIASLEHAPYRHQPAKRTAGVLAARATPDRFRPPCAGTTRLWLCSPARPAFAFFGLQQSRRGGACGALATLAVADRGVAEQVCSLNASVEPAEKFRRQL
jgi:hypothetical protein